MFGREVFLERLLLVAQDDARIVGVIERGSAVDGGLDEFSDVDLSIVCVETGYGQLLAAAQELAVRLGPLLTSYFAEHAGEPGLLICLYGPPLLHVDLKFVSQADLGSSAEAGIVLWERKEGSFVTTGAAHAGVPSVDPQWLEDRFWSLVHYIATKIGRGELFECISALNSAREFVFGPMLAARARRRPQGVRRIEVYAADALPLLDRTLAIRTRESCLEALHASIELYRRLREEADAHELVRRAEAEAAAVEYVSSIERAFD